MRRILNRVIPVLVMLVAFLPNAVLAQVAGQYRCWSYNVSGGGGSCRLAPPLTLLPDGTYQMSSERGTYKVQDGTIRLSESKIRGLGRLEAGNRVVFEYDYQGMHHTVTYICQNCRAGKPPR